MTDPAKPLRVLATRPGEQNSGWCECLRQSGIASLAVPVLAIETVREPQQRQAIKNLILNFDQFAKVIFVSQNAVREAMHWLDEFWPQLPCGIDYFAIGQRTADLLEDYGISASSCTGAMNSDELLAMPALQSVASEKVLLCRGRGGRPRLGEVLQARGAQVSYAEFYHRNLPSDAAERLGRTDFSKANYQEVLSIFSGESLSNLVAVLKEAKVDQWQTLPILVPGDRVAQQAQELGFGSIITARNATDNAMLTALLENCRKDANGSLRLQS